MEDQIPAAGAHRQVGDLVDDQHALATPVPHLFGTDLTEDDVSLASTQDLMGHADPKSTSVYVQLAQRRKAQVIDQHAPLSKMRTPVSDLLKRRPSG